MEIEKRLNIATVATSFLAPIPVALSGIFLKNSWFFFFGFVLGVPITFIVVLALGWPLYFFAIRRNLLSPYPATATGALCSAPFTLLSLLPFPPTAAGTILALCILASGALGGLIMWGIALRPNNSFKADSKPLRGSERP